MPQGPLPCDPAEMTSRVGWFKISSSVVLMAAVVGAGVAGRGPLAAAVRGHTPGTVSKTSVAETYGRLPVSFAPNAGQAGDGIDFVAHGAGYGLSLHPTGAVLALTSGTDSVRSHLDPSSPAPSTTSVVGIEVVGGDPAAKALGQDPLIGRVNYLSGGAPHRGQTDVPTFGRVTYGDVYPGVDLSYYGNQGALEYDFIVAPGADPGRIALGFQGAEGLRLAADGDLVIAVPGGELRQHAPRLYQDVGPTRTSVPGRFVLQGDRVGFDVGTFDRSRPLVIDPVLAYSSFLGARSPDSGLSIAVDSEGYAYVAGATSSPRFPTTPGAVDTTYNGGQDILVTKLTPDGSALVYSSFLGGSSTDDADSVAIDATGAAYLRGITLSPDFPVTGGAFDITFNGGIDAFVAKLSPDGSSLGYATFLGGGGFDSGSGIAVDASGSAYVVGITGSPDFPVTPGAYETTFNGVGGPLPPPVAPGDFDAYATKLTPDGTALAYSTFLGGARLDAAFEVAVDPTGRAAVTGVTASSDFPTTPGAYAATFAGGLTDAFVTRLAPDGSGLVYSTFLGGSDRDGALGLDVEANGAVHVTGSTASADFPTTPGAYDTTFSGGQDIYVAKLSANGTTLRFSTFIGARGDEGGEGLAVDGDGASYVTGVTQSRNFPTTPGAYDRTYGYGGGDAFVVKLNRTGTELAYSSFLGGARFDDGSDIAVGPTGAAFVAGVTRSPDFPSTPGAFDTTHNGGSDGFVTKLDAADMT